jgi:Ser/Thr protein kinase RdoA (MazF antagonist)
MDSFGLLDFTKSATLSHMPESPPVHERLARAVLPAYARDIGAPLRLLSLSENATYLVDDGDPMVLRVHRPGYHSRDSIISELRWMTALRGETEVVTPELIRARDGAEVVTTRLNGTESHVDAVTFIPGRTAEDDPDAVGFDQLGVLTAIMHQHAQCWTAPPQFTRFRWDLEATLGPRARWGDWRSAPGLSVDDRTWIERASVRIARELTEFGCAPDRFGLIHADLRLSNLMIDPGRAGSDLTVIDFDDCGWSWYLADLGAVVSWIEDAAQTPTIIADWLTGYRRIRSLPPDQLALIPTFVMLRRIMLTAWIGSHPEADAAIDVGDEFAPGTAVLAQRYLGDPTWLQDVIS